MLAPSRPAGTLGGLSPRTSRDRSPVFPWFKSRFSDLTDYEFEFLAGGVSGDLAYMVGFEHISVSVNGA